MLWENVVEDCRRMKQSTLVLQANRPHLSCVVSVTSCRILVLARFFLKLLARHHAFDNPVNLGVNFSVLGAEWSAGTWLSKVGRALGLRLQLFAKLCVFEVDGDAIRRLVAGEP